MKKIRNTYICLNYCNVTSQFETECLLRNNIFDEPGNTPTKISI